MVISLSKSCISSEGTVKCDSRFARRRDLSFGGDLRFNMPRLGCRERSQADDERIVPLSSSLSFLCKCILTIVVYYPYSEKFVYVINHK